MAGQCVVEEVTTQHSICAVVALYKNDQDSSPRVAGPGPTMLVFTCAVVALYKNDQDSASPRVAGPGPTMLALTCAAMAGCVKILAVFSNSIL